jgi:hypothetical protein
VDDVTGGAIDEENRDQLNDIDGSQDASLLDEKLESLIVPMFHKDRN